MALLIISDLHLSPLSTERNELFIQFLENALGNRDEVIIVGDLFDLWFGWHDLQPSYQQQIVKRMNDIAKSGLKITYVEGNRDFGISRLSEKPFAEVYPNSLERSWNGKNMHVEHGDLVNGSDKQYRVWRKISKNRFTYSLPRLIPSRILSRVAQWLEEKMKNTNLKYKTFFPEKDYEKFCVNCIEKGAEIVIVGHFHRESKTEFQTKDGRRAFCCNLPGWENGFRYLVIPDSGFEPYFKELRS